jgi:hypothetical protein
MCANIYSIKQTCFRESDIGILDYWTEQMRIKTQKGTLCFHQLLPGSVATMYFSNSRDTVQSSFLLRPENVLFAEHMLYNNRLFDVVPYTGTSLVCCMISEKNRKPYCFPWRWRPSCKLIRRHASTKRSCTRNPFSLLPSWKFRSLTRCLGNRKHMSEFFSEWWNVSKWTMNLFWSICSLRPRPLPRLSGPFVPVDHPSSQDKWTPSFQDVRSWGAIPR